MGTVSEAKYAYWRSIIALAAESGIPKAEWCRKNCISVKTFNHYQGIFRRQDARRDHGSGTEMDSFLPAQEDSSVSSTEDILTHASETVDDSEGGSGQAGAAPVGEDLIEEDKELSCVDEMKSPETEGVSQENEREDEVGDPESRFFEIPMASRSQLVVEECAPSAVEKTEPLPQLSVITDGVNPGDGLILEVGGFKLHIHDGVTEETLRTVWKVVGGGA